MHEAKNQRLWYRNNHSTDWLLPFLGNFDFGVRLATAKMIRIAVKGQSEVQSRMLLTQMVSCFYPQTSRRIEEQEGYLLASGIKPGMGDGFTTRG